MGGGGAAAAGKSVVNVAELGRRAAAGLGSMGVALGSCTVPAAGHPGFELGEDEIEYGLGIHGEPGVRKGPIAPADGLASTILSSIIEDLGLASGQRVALLVNGLGATPPMELDILLRGALNHLRGRGIEVVRAWCGNFLTALDMPGASLSLLKVDEELLALLDAPAHAPAWPGGGLLNDAPIRDVPAAPGEATVTGSPTPAGDAVRRAAHAAADALIKAEHELTDLDARAGDGDLGASLRRGAEAVLTLPDHAWHTPESALRHMADAMRQAIGGSSGPFYATGLMRAARELNGVAEPTPRQWHAALVAAADAIANLGGAKPGDRTMLDALYPAADAYKAALDANMAPFEALEALHLAATRGAEETATLKARAGRAAYLGDRAMGIADGGAVAVAIWMGALR
jgi:triose/dihydroxyacetone kinase / FAD-AMP lyase (cyclizing)